MESTDSSTTPQHPNLPPGFRFHPTDEELVVHYLKRKAASAPLPVSIIADIDLYKFDPWELPAKACFGEQEWYFFSPRERKYPNGARPNRAATSGYWKATGTDKPVLSSCGTQKVGVKKALVFYGGKPPKGVKTNWIMHEYRLADNKTSNKPPGCDLGNKKNSLRLDDWVLCRIYKKASINRPSMDLDRDDSIDDMMGGIPPSTNVGQFNGRLQFPKMSTSYARALIEDEHQNLMEGIISHSGINTSVITSPLTISKSRDQLDIVPTNSLTQKRTLSSLYWNDHHDQDMAGGVGVGASITNKRLSMDNGDDSVVSTEEHGTASSIASLLSQLPQTPSLQQQTMLGPVGDGLLRQPPYQLHGMNWFTSSSQYL